MAVTSVTIAGVEINDGIKFIAGAPMLAALEAANPRKALLLALEGRPPWFVDATLEPRSIPLIVFLLKGTYALRKPDWEELRDAINEVAEYPLVWVQDAVTKTLTVFMSQEALTDTYFHRVTGELTAADPRPI